VVANLAELRRDGLPFDRRLGPPGRLSARVRVAETVEGLSELPVVAVVTELLAVAMIAVLAVAV
jgi:hypothetical protein